MHKQRGMTRLDAVNMIVAAAEHALIAQYAVIPREDVRAAGSWGDAPFQLAEYDIAVGGYIAFWGLPRDMSLAEALLDYDDVVELAESIQEAN